MQIRRQAFLSDLGMGMAGMSLGRWGAMRVVIVGRESTPITIPLDATAMHSRANCGNAMERASTSAARACVSMA